MNWALRSKEAERGAHENLGDSRPDARIPNGSKIDVRNHDRRPSELTEPVVQRTLAVLEPDVEALAALGCEQTAKVMGVIHEGRFADDHANSAEASWPAVCPACSS